MKKILEKKENILFFNISDPNNEIRTNMCLKNFFNTFPSNLMLTDSLAQYLVKKKWNKTLLLTGPLKEDKEYSDAFKKSAKKFGVKVVGENFFVNNKHVNHLLHLLTNLQVFYILFFNCIYVHIKYIIQGSCFIDCFSSLSSNWCFICQ